MYEDPNKVKTDLGIKFGCVQTCSALELFSTPLSDNSSEPVDFSKVLTHPVQRAPSIVMVELSEPNSLIRWEHDLNS